MNSPFDPPGNPQTPLGSQSAGQWPGSPQMPPPTDSGAQWPNAPGQYPVAGIPYWGPQANWASPVDPTDCVGKRVGAAIIDSLILMVPQMAIMVGLMWAPMSRLFEDASRSGRSGTPVEPDFEGFWGAYFAAIFLLWAVQFLYFFVTEKVWEGSPGKLMLGLRVVRANGYAPISWGQSAGRNALRLLFDNGIVALILVLVTKGHRRVGDMVAHTLVIHKEWVGRFTEIWPPNGFPPWEPPTAGAGQMVLPPQPGYS